MRANVVVFVPEAIEGPLLGREAGTGRRGGFLLEGAMHSLVASVLIRAPWGDALMADS
jgi:hypothetical protein